MSKITKSEIDKLECPADKNLFYLWDTTLPGFGVRVTKGGVKSFIVRYRIHGEQRLKTLGRVSVINLSDAMKKAREKLQDAQSGKDPFISSRSGEIQTIEDLAIAFQKDRSELKKKTRDGYASCWKHIIEVLGATPIMAISDDHVKKLRSHLADKPTTFNRCVSLIANALKWKGLSTEYNSFKRAKKFKEKTRQRILSKEENVNFYASLGRYKKEKLPGWRYTDLFILLLLTGLRRDEWRTGRWEWIDWGNAVYTLPDNKTGGRVVYLSTLAIEVLKTMYEEGRSPKKGFIFPSPSGNKKKPMSWTWRLWDRMRKEVGLEGFRIHDMRHTAGSYAHSVGKLTQRQVADFLGHQRLETSSRYIHDAEKRESAEIAGQAIAEGWRD